MSFVGDCDLCGKWSGLFVLEKMDVNIGDVKMRFPESRWPGKFDRCGSHSMMHILVVCAAVIQMVGYLEAFDHAQLHLICAVS